MAEEIDEYTKYLNDCSFKTLERINKEVAAIGLEEWKRRAGALKAEASIYTGKQEEAERIEVRKYDSKVYKG